MSANPMPPMIPMSGSTGAMPQHGSSRFKPVDPVRILRMYMAWLVGALFVGVVLGVATWGILRLTMPRYTSIAQLTVGPPVGNPNSVAPHDYTGSSNIIERTIRNEVARLTSEQTLREALLRPEVQATSWYQKIGNVPDAIEDLQDHVLSVYPISDTTLINVSASTDNQKDPPVIINGIVSVYLLQLRTDNSTLTGDRRSAYTTEHRLLEGDIDRLKQQQSTFTQENQLSALDSRQSDAQQRLSYYTKNMADLESQLSATQEMRDTLAQKQQMGQTDPSPEDLAQVNAMPEVSAIQSRLDQYRENLRAAISNYGNNSYQASRIRNFISAAEQELELKRQDKLREMQAARIEQYANAVTSLQSQTDTLRQTIEETKTNLVDISQKLARYDQMVKELDMKNARLKQLDDLLSGIRIYTDLPDAQRVKRLAGTTAPQLTFPKPLVIVPGVTFFMLALTVGIIFLIETLDQRIKAPSDVKLIPDAELLGVLPDAAEDRSAPTGIERVVERYPTGLMAESFRNVRTAIMNKMDRHGYKTLMLVGAQPRSGTSNVVQNLAVSLAFHGRNVAIIDANFRRPSQHKLFDAPNDHGLADVLRHQRSVDQCLSKVDGLSVSVLTSGRSSDAPPELLEGSALRSIIGELESKFDVVLIDAPPALLTSESQLMAKQIDAVALVLRAINDTRGMIERMTRRFDGQRAEVLGMILNGVQSAAGGYFRKSYREFYRYRENSSTDNGSSSSSDRTTADDAMQTR